MNVNKQLISIDFLQIFYFRLGMAYLIGEGTAETYLEFFGRDFVRYFVNFGFDKILRVAGRTLRDFLFAIDQLHDSNRFAFPNMVQPLFHVTIENEQGATLDYK